MQSSIHIIPRSYRREKKSKTLKVAVFSKIILDSSIDYGKKVWMVASIYHTRNTLSDQHTWLKNTCGTSIKHCIGVVKIIPRWRYNMSELKKYPALLIPKNNLHYDIRWGYQYNYIIHLIAI